MLRRDLGFLVSRLMAVLGLYWFTYAATTLASTLWFAFSMPSGPKGVYPTLATQITLNVASVAIIGTAIWFLWCRAELFGGPEADADRTIHIDTSSLRATLVFGMGLFFLMSGLIQFVGLATKMALYSWAPDLPAVRMLVEGRPDYVDPAIHVLFGVGMVLSTRRPKWVRDIWTLAKADYALDEPDPGDSETKP